MALKVRKANVCNASGDGAQKILAFMWKGPMMVIVENYLAYTRASVVGIKCLEGRTSRLVEAAPIRRKVARQLS